MLGMVYAGWPVQSVFLMYQLPVLSETLWPCLWSGGVLRLPPAAHKLYHQVGYGRWVAWGVGGGEFAVGYDEW